MRTIAPPAVPSPSMNLADEYWEYAHRTDQLEALWRGDLAHLEEVEDFSPAGVAARTRRLEEFAARAATEEGPTAELVAFHAASTATRLPWIADLEMVNHTVGIVSLLATFLPRYPLVTAEHGERYLEKVARVDAMLAGLEDRLAESAAAGRTPVRSIAAAAADQVSAVLRRDPFSAQLPPMELPAGAAADWRGRLETELSRSLRPALARFADTVRTVVVPRARSDERPGLVWIDGGEEAYHRLLAAHTSLPLTAAGVHGTGLEQVARLDDEYRAAAGPLLGTTDLAEIYERLRTDPALHYRSPADLIADAEEALAAAAGAAPAVFRTTPAAGCVARAVDDGALAFYSPPAPDGSSPGAFFFNPPHPELWATFQLRSITFHESIPGHHFQLALAQETPGLHPVHSRLAVTAYVEGWALYAERLAGELGLYRDDLDRVGMLTADSLRACRLVVDAGMHGLGWSRERAVAYMLANSPMSAGEVEAEVDRYLGDPGQAVSYMVGRLEIDALRAEAADRLGRRFDLRDFHDAVLGAGSVTLPTLRRTVTDALR